MSNQQREQQHPQAKGDRAIINRLISSESFTNRDLAELGRLLIRYHDFPGAKDLQQDLQKILTLWKLTREELFQKTRKIHTEGILLNKTGDEQQDWS
jgi:hypothetical protein